MKLAGMHSPDEYDHKQSGDSDLPTKEDHR
jgi:hypothetical protein